MRYQKRGINWLNCTFYVLLRPRALSPSFTFNIRIIVIAYQVESLHWGVGQVEDKHYKCFFFLVSFLTLPSSSHSKASFNFDKIYISESHATLQWIPTLLKSDVRILNTSVILSSSVSFGNFLWGLVQSFCVLVRRKFVLFTEQELDGRVVFFLALSQSVVCLPQFIRAPWRSVVGKQNGSSLEKVISLVELKQNTKIVAIFIREYILCLLNANCVRDCPGPIYIPALLPAKGNLIN